MVLLLVDELPVQLPMTLRSPPTPTRRDKISHQYFHQQLTHGITSTSNNAHTVCTFSGTL